MKCQIEQANLFHRLHSSKSPLKLVNIWDAGSAKVIQASGAQAIATSSWSVAAAHGYADGEHIPFELALANIERIINAVDLPVTVDIESGYGHSPQAIKPVVKAVIKAGAVGINLEDQIINESKLYSIEGQCNRIKAVKEQADLSAVPLFINARTDIFLKTGVDKHRDSQLAEAVKRANAYAESGADGFFVPGLQDVKLIQKLCQVSPLPVNIMLTSAMSLTTELLDLGIARISYGPLPYNKAMAALQAIASHTLTV
jgi:2-methylisocitrate lyase-like PEP mutase family enzyme